MSWDHLAGTDNLGRDWFSRLLYGARLSLAVGIFAQADRPGDRPAGGAHGGLLRRAGSTTVLMRFTDLVYAFPDLLLIILLRSVLGGSIFALFLIIGLVTWVDDGAAGARPDPVAEGARVRRGGALAWRHETGRS